MLLYDDRYNSLRISDKLSSLKLRHNNKLIHKNKSIYIPFLIYCYCGKCNKK